MKQKTIGFEENINIIGGNQGAIYSTDKRNKINEIIFLKDDFYYNPTGVPFGQKVQFGRVWLSREGDILFI